MRGWTRKREMEGTLVSRRMKEKRGWEQEERRLSMKKRETRRKIKHI